MDVTQLANTAFLSLLMAFVTWLILRRIERLEIRLDRTIERVELTPTREEMNARIDRLEAEVGAMRSDLTHVALAVGARTRPQTG
jgi:HAMP domain-containing protein